MIVSVGHAAFQVTDLEASIEHATGVLGFREVARRDGTVFLSHGSAQHSLEYRQGPATGLDHVALQAQDGTALEEATGRLSDAGYQLEDGPDDPLVERNVRFRMVSGHVFDLFVPAREALDGYSCNGQPPWVPTGVRPRRVGHVNLNFTDVEAAQTFFTDVLGFRLSDIITTPDDHAILYFLRCGPAHHAVGVAEAPEDGIFHYAFEVDTVQDLVRLGDALDTSHRQLLWGPGRHGAGDNIATYHAEPSGVLIEYFAEMQWIHDDRWQPRRWRTDDYRLNCVWGVSPDVGALFASSIPVVESPSSVAA